MRLLEITEENNYGYKDFFLQGLSNHRDCFRISEADEKKESFPTKAAADSFTLAFVTPENRLAGVVSFEREGKTREKLRHKGLLFRMYVAEGFGGKGIGKKLVEAVINRVTALTDIEQINLTVIASNSSAKRLYQKFGFITFSIEQNAIKDGNVFYNEEQMVLVLKR